MFRGVADYDAGGAVSDEMGRRHVSRQFQEIERIEKDRDDARTALAEIAAALEEQITQMGAPDLPPFFAATMKRMMRDVLATHAAAIEAARSGRS